MMESPLTSLTYKGSISEAILEAKKQKKLFVVYISGEDAESTNLESSTWTNLNVAQSLSKYCILLHIREGSTDAANFSAIYPQKSVPSITAIGYTGTQVWQSEGFVRAEDLASSLEKAWLSLHLQETTASFLTAALASKKYDPSTSEASYVDLSDRGSSSSTGVPSHTIDNNVQTSEAEPSVTSENIEGNIGAENVDEGKNAQLDDKDSLESFNGGNSVSMDEQPSSCNVASTRVVSPVQADSDISGSDNISSNAEDGCPTQVKSTNHHSSISSGGSQPMQCEKAENLVDREVGASENCATVNKPTDVHLNIRLPDGTCLQEKFLMECTLRMVIDFVDRNESTAMGSYDLAIPYPRKVFSDQDLSKSLSELGLFNRQALIVVPHQKATGFHGGRSSSADQINSAVATEHSTGTDGGYLSSIKRIFSYINPLSYIGSGAVASNSGQESQSSFWEYSPNPSLRDNLAGGERADSSYSPNRSPSTSRNDSSVRRPTTSRYGSNIHTLKHDEDDSQFSDKNPFWNGNSTQYGGSSDGK